MCGIVGLYDHNGVRSAQELEGLIGQMTNEIIHRGPDDSGICVDAGHGLALGHRRLAIIDRSQAGRQPMHSASGRYVIIFNGEIYNFKTLAREIATYGYRFHGKSDTEVLLGAIEQWGLVEALKRANGMFALALWDKQEEKLSLAKDRAGMKPLYYGWVGKNFTFASELKPLRILPEFRGEINRDALALLLRYCYIPAPFSIYCNVFKLRSAELLTIPLDALQNGPMSLEEFDRYRKTYWSFNDIVELGKIDPWRSDSVEAMEELHARLKESIKLRMISDVSLGSLLSGGIDSSMITAIMRENSSESVKTFSIGFHEKRYNEAPLAAKVSKHLETDHTELYVTADEAMEVVPQLPIIYDEPFSDSSQIPTLMVSKLVRNEFITVALSGDGGDELFGGYNRYSIGYSYWKKFAGLPTSTRRMIAAGINRFSIARWNRLLSSARLILPGSLRVPHPGEKLHKLSRILEYNDPAYMYRDLCSHWFDPEGVVLGATEPAMLQNQSSAVFDNRRFREGMMYLDFQMYLPDDILTKIDRASMAVSLEMRCPFLDPELITFAWRVPMQMKIVNGKGKWLLRQLLYRYVPRELVERPKRGFGVPIDEWLRGPLRDWAEDLLNETRLTQEGYFDPRPIRQMWEKHLSADRQWHYHLWDVLMFQAWLDYSQ